MNIYLQEHYNLDRNLTSVFIDSWSQQPWNSNDRLQQTSYEMETEKLWNTTNSYSPFSFTSRSTKFNTDFIVTLCYVLSLLACQRKDP